MEDLLDQTCRDPRSKRIHLADEEEADSGQPIQKTSRGGGGNQETYSEMKPEMEVTFTIACKVCSCATKPLAAKSDTSYATKPLAAKSDTSQATKPGFSCGAAAEPFEIS